MIFGLYLIEKIAFYFCGTRDIFGHIVIVPCVCSVCVTELSVPRSVRAYSDVHMIHVDVDDIQRVECSRMSHVCIFHIFRNF